MAADFKKKCQKEMAKMEADLQDQKNKMKKEEEEQKKKYEEALKKQAEAIMKAAAADAAAKAAAEENRKQKERTQATQQKKLMEERRSQFKQQYAHTWDLGNPGISMFEFTMPEIGAANDVIEKLFYSYAIADVTIVKQPITRTYLENDVINWAGGDFKVIGVTTDDRKPEVIRIVEASTKNGTYPVSDTRFWATATGNIDYINWVKDQTTEKGTDEDDVNQFLNGDDGNST